MIAWLLIEAFVVAFCLRPEIAKSELHAEHGPKIIGGVPIMNYHLAFGGQSSMVETGEGEASQFLMIVPRGVTRPQIQACCDAATACTCDIIWHPEEGVRGFEVTCTDEASLELFVSGTSCSIEFAEPNVKVYSLPETSEAGLSSWGLERIGAAERQHMGQGVHIYMLDTGILSTHQDFGGRAIPTFDFTQYPPENCSESSNSDCSRDKHGHGTHCAGTAAGTTYGVAPQATINAVQMLRADGAGWLSWCVEAIDFVSFQASLGVRPAVASMSWGFEAIGHVLQEAIDQATDHGVIMVVASGNSVADACQFSPAFISSAITVGATDSSDIMAPWSNYGACVDIWAPGTVITSAHMMSDLALASWSGTSMSAAHAAGAAALVLEEFPDANTARVLEVLVAAAEKDVISGLSALDQNRLLQVTFEHGSGLGSSRPIA